MTPTPIQQARHRLETLWADTALHQTRTRRHITTEERAAIRLILDELHRLNKAVSAQEAALRAARLRAARLRIRKAGKKK